jgi:hypothetical protein
MRKRILLTVFAILVLGSVGTILSSFYRIDRYVSIVLYQTYYGFPFGWHGHIIEAGPVIEPPIDADWFSAESLLLDIVFWFVISSVIVIAIIKSVNMVHKRKI